MTCTPSPSLPDNVPAPPYAFDTAEHVIDNFNYARKQEGCSVPLSITPYDYQRVLHNQSEVALLLMNAERRDRGLGLLHTANVLEAIATGHSNEIVTYEYYGPRVHDSPVNRPGGRTDFIARLTVNPYIGAADNPLNHWSALAENIGAGTPSYHGHDLGVSELIYRLMYQDSNPLMGNVWGHRQNILGYVDNSPGHYSWVGIGFSFKPGRWGTYFTFDFLDDYGREPLNPRPCPLVYLQPKMQPPTVLNSETVQVTGVTDVFGGCPPGIGSVVFYADGPAVDSDGNFRTVPAEQTAPEVWQASLSVSDQTTLHAVAVNIYGMFTDRSSV